jgi:hypothetical protein
MGKAIEQKKKQTGTKGTGRDKKPTGRTPTTETERLSRIG